MTSASVLIQAPAKINLILRILDRRPDGYHNIWSLMHTVALHDELRITAHPRERGIELRCDDASLAVDHSNLVVRAATLSLERANRHSGLFLELKKRIPMGAGLGGGSSDAAATILGLNELFDLGWPTAVMKEIGQSLGSDVPFFFESPAGVVTGRGEQVRSMSLTGSRWVLLVNPGFPINTTWAYQELAGSRRHGGSMPGLEQHAAPSCRTWDDVAAAAVNDFEPIVFAQYPELRDIKRALLQAGAESALLSGSGATMFGVFEDFAKAVQAQERVSRAGRYKIFLVETCKQGIAVSKQESGADCRAN